MLQKKNKQKHTQKKNCTVETTIVKMLQFLEMWKQNGAYLFSKAIKCMKKKKIFAKKTKKKQKKRERKGGT